MGKSMTPKEPGCGAPDKENPEWTAEQFARTRPARDVLSPDLYAALTERTADMDRPALLEE